MSKHSLRIGVTCYPTYGGSGVVATEIGLAMAERGHKVHFIAYDVPRRLNHFSTNVFFHEVEIGDYPLLIHPPYALALTSKMVSVSEQEQLDILHVHYAVPHATSAFLAKQILRERAPKILTTLHGTDITLVGNDRSYLPITRFSIMESDGVTTPSQYLRHATYSKLQIPTDFPIEVVSNFVDTDVFSPLESSASQRDGKRLRFGRCSATQKTLVHVSNFRAVKRIQDIVHAFAKANQQVPCYLVLAGDGPERTQIESLVAEVGVQDKVCFLGKQDSVPEILQHSDLFLLPSETESFGLAALEAQSCGLPVIASRAGGIPEVISDGETGFLCEPKNTDEMAERIVLLLSDNNLYTRMSKAARQRAVEKFEKSKVVDLFEDYYLKIIAK